jgi:hypothetical protein
MITKEEARAAVETEIALNLARPMTISPRISRASASQDREPVYYMHAFSSVVAGTRGRNDVAIRTHALQKFLDAVLAGPGIEPVERAF